MRYLVPAFLFTILVVFFWVGLTLNPGEVPSPLIGKPAPSFDLPEINDLERRVNNESMQGRPALLNVWATWCAGCRQEHDMLLKLSASGVVPIFGLNYRDQRDKAQQWLRQLGNPYVAIGYDPDGAASLDWGVYGAPETFLIDPDGVVVYKHLGPLTPGVWSKEFAPRLDTMRGGSR